MTAPEILERIAAAGITLSADGGNIIARPIAAVTPEAVTLIRAHKSELLRMLIDPAAEIRRKRVLAMLAKQPETRFALLTTIPPLGSVVLLTLAIRNLGTCEFEIPRKKYDGVLLLHLIELQAGTVH
jgi:hypothetical protein